MGAKSRSAVPLARLAVGAMVLWCAFVAAARGQEAMPVTVVVARQSQVTEEVPVVGMLASREEVQVYPMVLGQPIRQILVETGQFVEKDQPLAVLDTTDARMLLDKNSVSLLRAKAAVAVENSKVEVALVTEAETRRTLERSRALQPKGAVSQQVLDEHRNAYSRAVAELGLARQSLALAEAEAELIARERREIELTIERSTVRAPTAGLVLGRSARLGAMTSNSGTPLFLIAEDGAMEFVAQVVETDFIRLRDGMKAEIALPGRKGPVAGTLRLRAARVDPVTRSGEVHIELDKSEDLVPGVFARGSIGVSSRTNVLLPGTAVRTTRGADTVLLVADGVVEARKVTVGARQHGQAEIVDGLRDGDMVVLKAGGFLKAGEKVEPVTAAPEPASEDELSASLERDQDGRVRR
ncbi:efflux RND transporter periplasmic adaptor subunit [Pseudomonas sp. R2.Fl]|nr:efflux RND transporter periplasmic adaptor subunit [Pseudomonas sp. R2.Fl]